MIFTTSYQPCDQLGFTYFEDTVQFALHAPHALNVTIHFFDRNETHIASLPLEKSDTKWHGAFGGDVDYILYQYELTFHDHSRMIFDPYGKFSTSSCTWGQKDYQNQRVKSIAMRTESFDWEEDTPLNHPLSQLIIYEMHTRGFTQDVSSKVENPGTFLGIIEKIPHLKQLGINAIELLPIQEFNESEILPPLTNYWGYSTVNFFQIMNRYFTKPNAISELKTLIKALHKAGIEVLLDVVYNHTGVDSPLFACDPHYYILDKNNHTNYTGCGNTINGNSPLGMSLITQSLRYLTEEFHIDGYRFDLASTLTRDSKGRPMQNPPLIETLSNDPILKSVKLIAEPWDPGGLYQVGTFPGRFGEWNAFYRDTIRKYLNGFEYKKADIKNALMGSFHLFKNKPPEACINFVTAHDGFSLMDLVSYTQKHNEKNREKNRDGSKVNFSINFGQEGPSQELLAIRKKQIKNFALLLFASIGTPMMCMGDEIGLSHQGNNNPWCQDDPINYVHWDHIDHDLLSFFQTIIELRKTYPHFSSSSYTKTAVTWIEQTDNNILCMTLDHLYEPSLLLAINPTANQQTLQLPHQAKWELIISTDSDSKSDFLPPYSSLVCKSINR